ncbi:hypothetical protein P872_22760 [Rhodonellum psychrophilum GCM71 = DSM 17998]|uniref:Phosphoglycerate mutase n=2 Tax=Rhodonellum TaxID=336827 RepID=U5BW79_9BACT|nr:hypothetical protein P872_22760 [Rhodonellum psychrophilum GCM71 = DSM 17998]
MNIIDIPKTKSMNTKILLSFFCLIFLLLGCGAKQEPKTIYIVRHAEKLLNVDDPTLNVAGTVRAKKLGQIMSDKEIAHVFSTNTIRTKATVQPVIDQSGLEIEFYDPKNHDDLVKELKNRKGNMLVVGHSNTVHHLANYFVGKSDPYPELTDIEYNFIFVVSLNPNGTSRVERKIYRDF